MSFRNDKQTFVFSTRCLEDRDVVSRNSISLTIRPVSSIRVTDCGMINLHLIFYRIPVSVNNQKLKRLLTDLDGSMKTTDNPYTVTFYGALFREKEVYICMECVDTSLNQFYLKAYQHGKSIEDILVQIAFAVYTLYVF